MATLSFVMTTSELHYIPAVYKARNVLFCFVGRRLFVTCQVTEECELEGKNEVVSYVTITLVPV